MTVTAQTNFADLLIHMHVIEITNPTEWDSVVLNLSMPLKRTNPA